MNHRLSLLIIDTTKLPTAATEPTTNSYSMNQCFPVSAPRFAVLRRLTTALLLLLACAPANTRAQTSANPPERIAFQGFLTDGTGVALATNAPKNYDLIFRIWNDQNITAATNRLWTEQQTVTVDKGSFSVLLGEGSPYSSEARPTLSSIFAAVDASDRYVECTVKGIGAGGSDVTILPRLRLLSSPYAFLAKSAGKLVNSTGADLLTSTANGITVNGSVVATAFSGPLQGSNLVAGSVTSSQIATGAVTSVQIAPGSIGAVQLAAGAIGASQIGTGAVGTVQIANGAVTSVDIANGAVGTAQLASGAVTSTQIAPGTIVAANIAPTLSLWDKASTTLSYSAGDVSVGVSGTPRNLSVFGNLNVYGGLSTSIGGTLYTGNAPQIFTTKTPGDQNTWQILTVNVQAFANRPGGFKIRIYEQHEVSSWEVRSVEGTMVFEQAGYTTGNSSYPGTCIRGSVSWTGGYGLYQFTIGTPTSGIQNNQILGENNWCNVYDFFPGSLIGGSNTKDAGPTYKIYFAFNPSVSGYVVISDY